MGHATVDLRLLADPIFTGAVAALAVNDGLLKDRWPGVVTGKLSDFAGVVVIAMLLAAISRRPRPSIMVTTAGFALLKLWPPVAQLAAPMLGGVTQTDPTDLIALVVLVPLGRWMASLRGEPSFRSSSLLVPVALLVALQSITATSCLEANAVDVYAVDGGRFLVHVHVPPSRSGAASVPSPGANEWFESTDGGRVWTPIPAPGATPVGTPLTEVCNGGGCFRAVREIGIERREGGLATPEPIFPADQRRRMIASQSASCAGGPGGWFANIAGVQRSDGFHIVVSMGEHGLLHRAPDGRWTPVALQLAHETYKLPPFGPPMWTAWLAVFVLLPLIGGIVAAACRGEGGRRYLPVPGVVVLSVLAMIGLAFFWSFITFAAAARVSGITTAASSVVVFAATLWLALARKRSFPLSPPHPGTRLG